MPTPPAGFCGRASLDCGKDAAARQERKAAAAVAEPLAVERTGAVSAARKGSGRDLEGCCCLGGRGPLGSSGLGTMPADLVCCLHHVNITIRNEHGVLHASALTF